ncbi:hypothetical protein BG006_006030 [Podila minutissima]|uniref:Secreted protein n=1 Tax=Podila minutissima TaxID=64525 RepID=A0A9P5VQC4_9FUNG|nr:hypothetical protein BG006_006030 [Podila minutissima]
MKFTTSIAAIALGAVALSSADAALSAGCSTYLATLSTATNPLAKCRVYTALGFPELTHAKDHDTAKLQKALTDYCAAPGCTPEQYAGVFKDLQANCASDMVAANQDTLGVTMYMWYLSAPQRDAVCLQNDAKTANCVIESINTMIARAQFPNDNPNEDDLYTYLQYVTPMQSAKGTNATAFCTSCNQQVANIFSNYYTKTPSPFALNLAQSLTSASLNTDLMYQYKTTCSVNLGADFKPIKPTGTGAASSPKPSSTDAAKSGAMSGLTQSTAGVFAAAAAVAGLMAVF